MIAGDKLEHVMNPTTLRNIQRLTLFAIHSASAEVSIPILKDHMPTGYEIHIAENGGPRGVWTSIKRVQNGFVIEATFKPVAVFSWCDRKLREELQTVQSAHVRQWITQQ